FGILCMDADRISLDVELTLVANAMGGPAVVVSGCSASVGYVNIYVMNGGIVGFAINTAFRNMVAGQVRRMLPNQLCGMVPGLINNMLNPMLANLPQVIPLSQMLSLITSVLSAPPQIPAYCYSPLCRGMMSTPPPTLKASHQPTMVQQSASTQRFRTPYSNVRPSYSNQQQRGAQILSSVRSNAVTAKRNKRMVGGPCAGCPPPSTIMQAGSVQNILQSLDLRKLADFGLSLRLMSSYSTNQEFIVDLYGEFSPRGWGGTPFGPFPVFFPNAFGVPMVEAVLSDYTINSLLYWIHKREFLAFRIGPEMAAFSNLLNTTCGEDYDDASDASSEETRPKMRRKILRLLRRTKRQSIADLEALGVCIGDIAPALAEKYPNRKLFLIIRTARAPSVIISARNGGTATVDLLADATMYLQGTTKRVGNLRISIVMDITLRLRGNWIGGIMALRVLKIVDTDGTLGIAQDALDSISSLAKSAIVKTINKALEKGMRLPMPALPLPINLYNMRVGIVEHGIYLASDI
uniref:Lipid-binding serum glycoprotein C-terminal domain-containing protein n=1 Tax=Parascaris univalens TaxID=6257 RepID=A0A915CIR4_PARUN